MFTDSSDFTGISQHRCCLLFALVHSVLLDCVGFTCHCTLIHGYFIGVEQITISWYLHAFSERHYVTYHELILVKL